MKCIAKSLLLYFSHLLSLLLLLMVCALDPKVVFGKYYSDCQVCDDFVNAHAFDEELAAKLSKLTEDLISAKIKSE